MDGVAAVEMDSVTADVVALIASRLPVARRSQPVKLDDRFDELGLDSFAAVELIFDLEEKFDIQIPYNSNETKLQFDTVGEIVDAIKTFTAGRS